MATNTKAVTIYEGRFAVAESAGGIAGVLAEALAPGEQLSLSTFPTIKIPAGGGLAWTLPDGDPAKEIECVIVHRQPVRAYWAQAFSGEGNPPECASLDNLVGIGTPGGQCDRCPLNEWESKGDGGSGKACRQITRLFVLLPDSQLPILMPIPPSSYKATQSYVLGLAGTGQSYYSVASAISLVQSKNRGGITYSQVAFRRIAPLGPEVTARIAAYRTSILPFLTAAPVSDGEGEA